MIDAGLGCSSGGVNACTNHANHYSAFLDADKQRINNANLF